MRRFRSSSAVHARSFVAGSLAIGLAAMPRAAAGQKGPLPVSDGLVAAASANQECCRLLLLPIGAQQTAMGMAVVPMSSPEAVFYNPAGLADVDGLHVAIHHTESNFQPYDAFTVLFSPGNLAVFGISYGLLDYGDQDVTGPDFSTIGRLQIADHLLIATFATTLFSGFSTGVNYKYYNLRIDCSGECNNQKDVNAFSHMVDVGLQYQPAWMEQLRFGVALVSAGTAMQVINADQASPAPTRLRMGVSYEVLQHLDSIGPYALRLLVEAQEDDWKQPTSPRASFGFEASVGDFVFLRGGFGGGDAEGLEGGPAVGIGIIYSRFNVAVAKRVQGGVDGDEPFHFSVDVGF